MCWPFGNCPLVQALCNADYLRPLRVEVWDWDRDGAHDFMGTMLTNLKSLLEGQGHEMDLQVRRWQLRSISYRIH